MLKNKIQKLIIIGAGPSGVSAALYLIQHGITPLIIHNNSGSLIKANKIINHYGIIKPISGKKLYKNGIKQLKSIDNNIMIIEDEVLSIKYNKYYYNIITNKLIYNTRSIILSTGIKHNTLNIIGIKKYKNFGISYCADCDGFFYKNKKVAVIGSGNYALHEAKILKLITNKVTIFTNNINPTFDVKKIKNINIITEKIISIGGKKYLQWIKLRDNKKIKIDGIFIAIGVADSINIAKKIGLITKNNYIIVNKNFNTILPGFFASGDCIGKPLKIYKAIYDGMLCAMNVVNYLQYYKK